MIYVCLQWLFPRNRVKVFSSLWAICRCLTTNMKGILCNLYIPQLSIGRQYWPICWSRLLYWLTCRSICRLTLDRVSADQYVSQYTGRHSANEGSAKCRWNIGQLSVAYRSTVTRKYMYTKIRIGKLGFSVTREILQSVGLKKFPFCCSCQPRSTSLRLAGLLPWFYACYIIRLSLNASQRGCHSGPYFFQKKK